MSDSNTVELRNEWCRCGENPNAEEWSEEQEPDAEDWIERPDGTCSCLVIKHHWHCPQCGRILQIG